MRGRQRGVMVSQGVARKRKAVRAVAVTTPEGPNSPKPKPSDRTSRKKDAIVLRLTLLPIGGRPPGAAEGLSALTGGEKACARGVGGWVCGGSSRIRGCAATAWRGRPMPGMLTCHQHTWGCGALAAGRQAGAAGGGPSNCLPAHHGHGNHRRHAEVDPEAHCRGPPIFLIHPASRGGWPGEVGGRRRCHGRCTLRQRGRRHQGRGSWHPCSSASHCPTSSNSHVHGPLADCRGQGEQEGHPGPSPPRGGRRPKWLLADGLCCSGFAALLLLLGWSCGLLRAAGGLALPEERHGDGGCWWLVGLAP